MGNVSEARLAAEHEREASTRRALVRTRQVAAVCVVLAVLAAGAAGFGIWGMRQAETTRAHAEAARGEAERLVDYLLDDFYRELEPVGRLELVGELARRALDYYDGLPDELRGGQTRRNRALAQVRYSAVLRSQGRDDEARRALAASLPTLEALRAGGDESEPTTIGLALGLVVRARLERDALSLQTVTTSQQAVDLLEPRAGAADASVALRRTQAAALTQLGFAQLRSGRPEPAIASLQQALAVYRGIDGLTADADAAANFAVSSAWLTQAFSATGRLDDALRVADEGRAVATALLERRPTHMMALRARALLSGAQANAFGERLQQGRRLASADEAARDWLQLMRVDPSNVISANNLGAAQTQAAEALLRLGRPRESIAMLLQNRAARESMAERSRLVLESLSFSLRSSAFTAAELGELALAADLWSDFERRAEQWWQGLAPGSVVQQAEPLRRQVSAGWYAFVRGDRAAARAAGQGIHERLMQIDFGTEPDRRRIRASLLQQQSWLMAFIEFEAGDFAAAEPHVRRLEAAQRELPLDTLTARGEHAAQQALAALVLARLGRADEARERAAQALAIQREMAALDGDDELQKSELAFALLASAWAEPGRAPALLAEAQAAHDAMPAEARRLFFSRWLDAQMAEARRALR